MFVVADTSPLCYLILIDQIQLLPQLYTRVVIPQAVYQELRVSAAPQPVQDWLANPPDWLEIHTLTLPNDQALNLLDQGEAEAIALTESIGADLMLIDEKRGRQTAIMRGLKVIGLLGILVTAANDGLIDFAAAIAHLQTTSFRASPKLIQSLLDQYSGK